MTLPTDQNAQLLGIDFTSSPTRRKPIAVVKAHWDGAVLVVDGLLKLGQLEDFEKLLIEPGPFVAAIDMPFGLSRELVDGLGWPGAHRNDENAWADLIRFYGSLAKDEIRSTFRAWCDSRPAGGKFAHRASDKPAGASPSMKWVNPPVAMMLRAGAPYLLASAVHIPGMQQGDLSRVAIEAYPGFLARKILNRQSYKTDTPSKDAADRQMARSELVCAMEEGMLLGIRMQIPTYIRAEMLLDAKGDLLDACLCALIAGWCVKRSEMNFGLPPELDPVEGWIAGVPYK